MVALITARYRRALLHLAATSPIWCVSFMHAQQAGVLLSTDAANGSIVIASMLFWLPSRPLLVTVLLLCASAGWAAIFSARSFAWSLALLLPQQLLLLAAFTGAIKAVLLGNYADGVPRPHIFIYADQLALLMWAIAHLVASSWRVAMLWPAAADRRPRPRA